MAAVGGRVKISGQNMGGCILAMPSTNPVLASLLKVRVVWQGGLPGFKASSAISLLPGLHQGSELFWASVFLVSKMGVTTTPAS